MIGLTIADIAAAVGGTLDSVADPEASVTGSVEVDSREIGPGGLFVARRGDHADGHEFAAAAVEAGAAVVIAERPVGVPAVIVDDAERALGRLARAVVDRLPDLTVVAVTGSSGKTTTKDMLAQVLEVCGPVVSPPGSYNTEVGVPISALRVTADTRVLVTEMGARGVGHIAYLCEITPPDLGIVLNVGSAHVGEFGDRATIARAKSELVEAVHGDGAVVLNGDDTLVRGMAEQATAPVLMVGESVHADVRAENVAVGADGRAAFDLITPNGEHHVALRFVGEHQVANALAVAGAAHTLGIEPAVIAERLSAATPQSRWRMEVTERPDGVTVVNDAYNANPESMRAALKSLAIIGRGRRTVAVLGEMLELGESSIAEHDAIGRLAVRLNVSLLVVVGAGAAAMHQGAQLEGSWDGESVLVNDLDEAQALLAEALRPGDVVLVKSSRDAGLRFLGDRLAGRESDSAASSTTGDRRA